jgi:hypothetical protein
MKKKVAYNILFSSLITTATVGTICFSNSMNKENLDSIKLNDLSSTATK